MIALHAGHGPVRGYALVDLYIENDLLKRRRRGRDRALAAVHFGTPESPPLLMSGVDLPRGD